MQNPDWHRDEIILALDLYFATDRGKVNKKGPEVAAVSTILKNLPIHLVRPDEEKFRNANGVYLKLSNFKHFDPEYKGAGMKRASKQDGRIFKEFYHQQDRLASIAREIKKIAADPILQMKIYNIEDDEQDKEDSVFEGQLLYKLHKVRERNTRIIKKKKDQVWNLIGKLSCESCLFEFQDYYGEIGKKYIECHHRTPLANFKVATKTTLDDLALVCSNCHRMLHRRIDTITVEDLRMMIKYDRA